MLSSADSPPANSGTDAADLGAVRARREALYEAMSGLEAALAGPIGAGADWLSAVAEALAEADNRIQQHITETELPGGLLETISSESPRLIHRVRELEADHAQLEGDVGALRRRLSATSAEAVETHGSELRKDLLLFVGRLSRHRQRGSDLLYEAYQVDIGAAD